MSELRFVVGAFLTLHIKCEESLWEFLHLSWHVRRCTLWRPYSDTLFLRFHGYISLAYIDDTIYLQTTCPYGWAIILPPPLWCSLVLWRPFIVDIFAGVGHGYLFSVFWWIVSFCDGLCWKREVSLMMGENYNWIIAKKKKKPYTRQNKLQFLRN